MGCDIHLYTEVKRSINNQDVWVNSDNWKFNPYYGDTDNPQWLINSVYQGRDYELFSILADVRNKNKTPIISSPKGLPADVSEIVKASSDAWSGDAHSHSFLSLGELVAFADKHKTVKRSGMIHASATAELQQGIKPMSWCGWTNVKGFEFREWEDDITGGLSRLIEALKSIVRDEFWKFETEEISPEYYEKARIVFWFDN